MSWALLIALTLVTSRVKQVRVQQELCVVQNVSSQAITTLPPASWQTQNKLMMAWFGVHTTLPAGNRVTLKPNTMHELRQSGHLIYSLEVFTTISIL